MQTRIYVVQTMVTNVHVGNPRLIEAGSAAQAIGHVVRGQYKASVASPKEIALFMNNGVRVEQAGESRPCGMNPAHAAPYGSETDTQNPTS